MAHDFLTEDARRLMQRLQEQLQESFSGSLEDSDNSSTVTFEPDPSELERTASADRRRLSPALRDFRPLSPFLSQTHRTLSIEKTKRSSRPRIEDLSRTLPRDMHPAPRTPRKATPPSSTSRNRPRDQGDFSPVPRPKPALKAGIAESMRKQQIEGKKGALGGFKGKLQPSTVILKAGMKAGGGRGQQEHRVADYLLNKQRKIEEMRKALRPSFTPDISASSKKLVKRMLFTQKKSETSRDWKGLVLSVDPTAETQDSAPDTPRLRSPAVD